MAPTYIQLFAQSPKRSRSTGLLHS